MTVEEAARVRGAVSHDDEPGREEDALSEAHALVSTGGSGIIKQKQTKK
jgi:hypothetical protein